MWSREERYCLSLLQRSQSSPLVLLAVHAFLLRRNLDSNTSLCTFIISLIGDHRYARKLFDRLPNKDSRLSNALIQKFSRHNHHLDHCVSIYRQLCRETIDGFPDTYTFPFLFKSCIGFKLKEAQFQLHGQVIKMGFSADVFTSTALVDAYVKCGDMDSARKLFDQMPVKSPVTWTAITVGYARSGDTELAVEMFKCMPDKDTAAFNAIIDVFVKFGDVVSAQRVFEEMPEKNVVSWTSLLSGYCKIGDMDSARSLFDEMDERNLYSWNTMINGYSQNARPHEALELFRELQSSLSPFSPDDVTIVSVIPAVADVGAIELGRWIHNFSRRNGLEKCTNVATALVDMYAKCGDIKEANRVFGKMLDRTIASWNTMINGFAINGLGKEALKVFDEMLRNGFCPNEVTMIEVLYACSHAGLVDEGKKWFSEMESYGIKRRIDHYGCMVDLLGRGGHLDEAERLMHEMPCTINSIIISSLLFACVCHGDVTRAEKILGKSTKVEPMNPRNCIMLRNLYAWNNRWSDVARSKDVMRELGGKREAGSSVVEIDSTIWEFVSGDRGNPYWEMISRILECVQVQMKGKRVEPLVEAE